MKSDDRESKYELFKSLHTAGKPFILPNAWDAMSAKLLRQCGFPAIGTTSAGIAASLGYADGERIGMRAMMTVVSQIAGAVDLPVTADLEAGYGCEPREIGEVARMAAVAGAVGLNIEDGAGGKNPLLLDADDQARRIAAMKEATHAAGLPMFVNARIDSYWYGIGDKERRLDETLKRAEIYLGAGADGIFVPGLSDLETIGIVAGAVSLPLNVLAGPDLPKLAALAEAGVARVSTGSGPYRAAMTALRDFGMALHRQEDYAGTLKEAISYQEMQRLLEEGNG